MQKLSRILKIVGIVLFAWPFVFGALGLVLSWIFWCDIVMRGVVESVSCSINTPIVENLISSLINAHWFALFTFLPSIALILLSELLSPKTKSVEVTETQRKKSKVSKIAWVILILFCCLIALAFSSGILLN